METVICGAANLGCSSFVQRDGNNTETVPFPMFFAFVLYGNKAEECNIAWPIAHEVNRCIFWTSCTAVSRKRSFLSIMRNFGYSCPTMMIILVGRVLHAGTEFTLIMSYLGCFLFSLCRNIRWTKSDSIVQEVALCTCFMDTKVHKTELCTFWTIETFVSRKHFFYHKAWIWAQFDH